MVRTEQPLVGYACERTQPACVRSEHRRYANCRNDAKSFCACGHVLSSMPAPLVFARNAVVVSIHLCPRAVLEEELRLLAGSHLGTIDATVTREVLGCRRYARKLRGRRRRGIG